METLDVGYHITRNGESVITNGNFTEKTISTCDGNDDGNFIVDWNFSPINVTCEIVSLKYAFLKCVIVIGPLHLEAVMSRDPPDIAGMVSLKVDNLSYR